MANTNRLASTHHLRRRITVGVSVRIRRRGSIREGMTRVAGERLLAVLRERRGGGLRRPGSSGWCRYGRRSRGLGWAADLEGLQLPFNCQRCCRSCRHRCRSWSGRCHSSSGRCLRWVWLSVVVGHSRRHSVAIRRRCVPRRRVACRPWLPTPVAIPNTHLGTRTGRTQAGRAWWEGSLAKELKLESKPDVSESLAATSPADLACTTSLAQRSSPSPPCRFNPKMLADVTHHLAF